MFHLLFGVFLISDVVGSGQSETFEYVRLDKKYRYVSEQVSHHPPISACWAESPLWHYFGEVIVVIPLRFRNFFLIVCGIG
jgi:hypothetical protein